MSVALLWQLFRSDQLTLAPEFQRNSVWPRPAKAYLIDTILNDRPIPFLFFQRATSSQTGKPTFSVIDGQQRLRAIFEFLEDGFPLAESKNATFKNKKFSKLPKQIRNRILDYDLRIEELSGYSESDIRDMFVRMNRYVVKLSPQELRHARSGGRFHDFIEDLGKMKFWSDNRVFSKLQLRRMRAVEFSAEVTILLIEGPQDKKKAIDLYYGQYKDRFPSAKVVRGRLLAYLDWIQTAMPELRKSSYRKPVDLYSLIGALDKISLRGARLSRHDPNAAGVALLKFERQTHGARLGGDVAKYVVAASQQTDNITPRTTRIRVLESILRSAL